MRPRVATTAGRPGTARRVPARQQRADGEAPRRPGPRPPARPPAAPSRPLTRFSATTAPATATASRTTRWTPVTGAARVRPAGSGTPVGRRRAQRAQPRHQQRDRRRRDRHDAEEDPAPADALGDGAGQVGPDESGQHPGRGEQAEHAGSVDGRVDPADQDVERDAEPATAQALEEPAGDQRGHPAGGAADQQPEGEDADGAEQRPGRAGAVDPQPGQDHADDAGAQGRREGDGVPVLGVEVGGHHRHHGGDRQRLEGGEEHQGDRADGGAAVAGRQQRAVAVVASTAPAIRSPAPGPGSRRRAGRCAGVR